MNQIETLQLSELVKELGKRLDGFILVYELEDTGKRGEAATNINFIVKGTKAQLLGLEHYLEAYFEGWLFHNTKDNDIK